MKNNILFLVVALALVVISGCPESVDEPALPTARFNITPDSGAAPLEVSFIDLSLGQPSIWQWDFGDGDTSTLPNPVHVYTDPGQYTVCLTVYNDRGGDELEMPNCISVDDTTEIPVLVLPWYDLYAYQRIITTTTGNVETTYVEGDLWSNWEPVEALLVRNGTITVSWDTLDFWNNPYSGDMTIVLNDTWDQVVSFSVEAFVSEGATAWGTRHIVFEGHNVYREDSSAAGMLFRVWGGNAYPLIDSFSQHLWAHDGSVDQLTTGFICLDSSRVEIRITEAP